MATLTVETDVGFLEQTLANGARKRISHPIRPVDPRFLEEARDPRNEIVLSFDGVKAMYRTDRGYPNATFSHYATGRALRDLEVKPKRLVDLGCGVGFIGNYASVHLSPKEIVFADLNPNALAQSMTAYLLNTGQKPHEVQLGLQGNVTQLTSSRNVAIAVLGDVRESLTGLEADVATAAPFYIPLVCEVFPQAYNIFAARAKAMGATLFIGHSNLAQRAVEDAANANQMKLAEVARIRTPLPLEYTDGRIFTTIQRDFESLFPEVEAALEARGLEINTTNPDRPRYYHHVVISELSAN